LGLVTGPSQGADRIIGPCGYRTLPPQIGGWLSDVGMIVVGRLRARPNGSGTGSGRVGACDNGRGPWVGGYYESGGREIVDRRACGGNPPSAGYAREGLWDTLQGPIPDGSGIGGGICVRASPASQICGGVWAHEKARHTGRAGYGGQIRHPCGSTRRLDPHISETNTQKARTQISRLNMISPHTLGTIAYG
jgi:hypothetical protein